MAWPVGSEMHIAKHYVRTSAVCRVPNVMYPVRRDKLTTKRNIEREVAGIEQAWLKMYRAEKKDPLNDPY